jgi:hypothetical protein
VQKLSSVASPATQAARPLHRALQQRQTVKRSRPVYQVKLEDDVLCCPHCGFDYLHHDRVIVYSRKEDEETTAETEVTGRATRLRLVPSELSKNPSVRRDGVAISFWCEGCDERPELTITQHKGNTYFVWR